MAQEDTLGTGGISLPVTDPARWGKTEPAGARLFTHPGGLQVFGYGSQVGWMSGVGSFVSCTGLLPSAFITQMSAGEYPCTGGPEAWVNAIR